MTNAKKPTAAMVLAELVELEPRVEHLPEPICADLYALIDRARVALEPAAPTCRACGGNGYSGGIVPVEPEICDGCESCLGTGREPAAPVEDGEVVLPCDVKVPPATTITKGCKLSTLIHALELRGMAAQPPAADALVEAAFKDGFILGFDHRGRTDDPLEAVKGAERDWNARAALAKARGEPS